MTDKLNETAPGENAGLIVVGGGYERPLPEPVTRTPIIVCGVDTEEVTRVLGGKAAEQGVEVSIVEPETLSDAELAAAVAAEDAADDLTREVPFAAEPTEAETAEWANSGQRRIAHIFSDEAENVIWTALHACAADWEREHKQMEAAAPLDGDDTNRVYDFLRDAPRTTITVRLVKKIRFLGYDLRHRPLAAASHSRQEREPGSDALGLRINQPVSTKGKRSRKRAQAKLDAHRKRQGL